MDSAQPTDIDLIRLLERTQARVRRVDPAAVEARLDDYLVVDVREAAEVLLGYLPGAVHVPRGMLEFRACRDPRFADRSRPILAYSEDGQRSILAAWTLQQLGFSNVASLNGGFRRWAGENRPIE